LGVIDQNSLPTVYLRQKNLDALSPLAYIKHSTIEILPQEFGPF
jgi:hypothetical protein